ncbi:DUF190 domain-containing protein [Desulfothermus okinawensis]
MMKAKLLKVYVKEGDKYKGSPIYKYLLEFLQSKGIGGATVYKGICGYGVRGVSEFDIFRLSMDLPLVIECIDEEEKIEPLLPEIYNIVQDNGLIIISDCLVHKGKKDS